MAYSYVTLKKEEKDKVSYKTGYYGYSLLSLISPAIVALLRKNYAVLACVLVVYQIYSVIWQNYLLNTDFELMFTGEIVPVYLAKFLILNILFVFCYNRFEISILENIGYKVCSENEVDEKQKYNMSQDEELKEILRAKR